MDIEHAKQSIYSALIDCDTIFIELAAGKPRKNVIFNTMLGIYQKLIDSGVIEESELPPTVKYDVEEFDKFDNEGDEWKNK